MINRADSSANIEVTPARRDQEAILANLLELYAHDFSEFHDVAVGPDGRFGYKSLPLYWSEGERHPFLVFAEGRLAGFALVKRGSEFSGDDAVWDMAEFFVLRGYRRRGVGTHVAHHVWKSLPGRWEVRVMESNVAGHDFWARAIAKFTGTEARAVPVQKDEKSWKVYSFEA